MKNRFKEGDLVRVWDDNDKRDLNEYSPDIGIVIAKILNPFETCDSYTVFCSSKSECLVFASYELEIYE